MDLREVTYETFEHRVGDVFRAHVGDGESLDLELTEATQELAAGRPDHAFSLVFRGPSETPLVQRIYDLDHADLGSLSIFLVPIAHGEDGYSYEAVFTRMKEERSDD